MNLNLEDIGMASSFMSVAEIAEPIRQALHEFAFPFMHATLDRLWQQDIKLLKYLRWYEWDPYDERRRTTRLAVRNEVITFYMNLLELCPPQDLRLKTEQIIEELRSIPVGPFSEYPRQESELNFHGPGAEQRKREAKVRNQQRHRQRLITCLSNFLITKTEPSSPG